VIGTNPSSVSTFGRLIKAGFAAGGEDVVTEVFQFVAKKFSTERLVFDDQNSRHTYILNAIMGDVYKSPKRHPDNRSCPEQAPGQRAIELAQRKSGGLLGARQVGILEANRLW
jgi:hypothetical protein